MEPPVHPFKNTPTPAPKQCKHVKAAAPKMLPKSAKKYKTCHLLENTKSNSFQMVPLHHFIPNSIKNNRMETCRYAQRSLAV